ncbi:polyprenyl synthetase family protein [Fluviispira sanaruensis]|uniref:Polyprenyl synthetase family protein n=1 Tax=Fluviispira sanaruensis TaxID=2493639 RepID=A0A4P2VJI5_FLUSA|nr:polyprenyl synthetase family protein [Fluviispira sanaruensis]BBH53326.1 polyprenyl synthetase family protein [Fluviispira sanaruensis]
MSHNKNQRQNVLKDFNYFNIRLNEYLNNLEKKMSDHFFYNIYIKDCIKESLLDLTRDSLNAKAKRIRPLLCSWIFRNHILVHDFSLEYAELEKKEKLSLNKCLNVLFCIEILHCASLIIDDIEDGSLERRGQQTLYLQYGIPNTLNTGTWMYFLAIKTLPKSLHTIAVNTLYDCHIGQALDLSNNNPKFIESLFFGSSEHRWEYYKKCAELKTARLLQFSIDCLEQMLKIDKKTTIALKKLFMFYGLSFQMFDDIKNILPDISGHKSYEDLNSGLRSSISLTFLDLLSQQEKREAYNEFLNSKYSEFILSHNLYKYCLRECYNSAQNYLDQSSLLLDEISCNADSREYIHFILENPIENIRRSIANLLSEPQLNFNELQSSIL